MAFPFHFRLGGVLGGGHHDGFGDEFVVFFIIRLNGFFFRGRGFFDVLRRLGSRTFPRQIFFPPIGDSVQGRLEFGWKGFGLGGRRRGIEDSFPKSVFQALDRVQEGGGGSENFSPCGLRKPFPDLHGFFDDLLLPRGSWMVSGRSRFAGRAFRRRFRSPHFVGGIFAFFPPLVFVEFEDGLPNQRKGIEAIRHAGLRGVGRNWRDRRFQPVQAETPEIRNVGKLMVGPKPDAIQRLGNLGVGQAFALGEKRRRKRFQQMEFQVKDFGGKGFVLALEKRSVFGIQFGGASLLARISIRKVRGVGVAESTRSGFANST
ncbi:MAG: hypothetical protein ACLFRG_02980 [Desulfococcaceae bacterium]